MDIFKYGWIAMVVAILLQLGIIAFVVWVIIKLMAFWGVI